MKFKLDRFKGDKQRLINERYVIESIPQGYYKWNTEEARDNDEVFFYKYVPLFCVRRMEYTQFFEDIEQFLKIQGFYPKDINEHYIGFVEVTDLDNLEDNSIFK